MWTRCTPSIRQARGASNLMNAVDPPGSPSDQQTAHALLVSRGAILCMQSRWSRCQDMDFPFSSLALRSEAKRNDERHVHPRSSQASVVRRGQLSTWPRDSWLHHVIGVNGACTVGKPSRAKDLLVPASFNVSFPNGLAAAFLLETALKWPDRFQSLVRWLRCLQRGISTLCAIHGACCSVRLCFTQTLDFTCGGKAALFHGSLHSTLRN